ncbi:hypothetical protein COHA_005759 [Chlorella ohadii]|uniref:Ankyrin repeat domain-containing protein n=1 Tax=Chlorella ohadii TaxID=2649997 RepID=A0AAD5DQI5_9CHLO|nr:hypothetical protein COHA_005759 [Chlorella ohadii]
MDQHDSPASSQQRAALLQRLPLHAALLSPGTAGAPAADPFADGAPPLNPQLFSGAGGFSAMHAAALANAPGAIAKLAAAGCPADSRLIEDLHSDEELQLLLSAVPPGPARRAAHTAVRGGATPLALAVLAPHPEAAAALLAAGSDPRQRLWAYTRRWESEVPMLMYCIYDPEAEQRGDFEFSADAPRRVAVLETLLQAGADPCAETQLRIPGFVPPTYPLKEAWSTEAVAEAVHEGATEVVAAALPHLSAAERREALSGDSTQQAAVLGKEAMLRLLVQEGAPFGLAEREYALYWGLELCSPEAVRLALSWGGGPAELVQHCERARAVAAAVAAARPGSYLSTGLPPRARKIGAVAALVDCCLRGFPRVGDPDLNPEAPPQEELQRTAAGIAETLIDAGFKPCPLDPPGTAQTEEDWDRPLSNLPADSPLRLAIERRR